MFNLFNRKKPKSNAYDLIEVDGDGDLRVTDLRATEAINDAQRVAVYELTEDEDAPTVQLNGLPAVGTNGASAKVSTTNGSAPAPVAVPTVAAPAEALAVDTEAPAPSEPTNELAPVAAPTVATPVKIFPVDDADAPAPSEPTSELSPVAAPTVATPAETPPVDADAPAPTEPTREGTPVTRVAATHPNATETPVISIRGMTKVYTMGDMEVRALNGVDLDIQPGEMIAIMGPSGSGKSTLMNMLGCLDVPSGGTYLLDGTDVSKLNDNQLADIRGRKLGFVFQSFNLLARTTAIANVELPLVYAGGGAGQRRKRAAESLALVGLGDRLDHKPNELSGGQQQRVAIARALINHPKMILADEPTGNLDTRTSTEIMGLFQRLNKEQGITVVFVTHDVETADYCRRVIHIRDGVIERDERK